MYNNNQKIYVRGGCRLEGEVSLDGSKNSALSCMVAACLVENGEVVRLKNVPDVSDVRILIEILRGLGKTVEYEENTIALSGRITDCEVSAHLAGKLRGSTYCLGLLIGTVGKARVGLPGGDAIGERPIDIHLQGMSMLGMCYTLQEEYVEAECGEGLKGAEIYLRFPSVGATCNLMIAAAKAEGRTIIDNAAKEPEIVDLANLLCAMGIRVTGAGTDRIAIYGTTQVRGNIIHDVISDRIEAGVLLTSVAITGGRLTLRNSTPYHYNSLLHQLRLAGTYVDTEENTVYVDGTNNMHATRVTCMPFPGIATDMQPQFAVLCLQCEGESVITDMVFPERFSYVKELNKMGAGISRRGNSISIIGKRSLIGTDVTGNDIRAVTALICAGMIAEGETVIDGMVHLNRGYHNIIDKWRSLGANIDIR